MFLRKITSEYEKWYQGNQNKKTALVVKGARQIGKTTSVLEFAKEKYQNVIYINFKDNKSIKSVFNQEDYIVDDIILLLQTYFPNESFVPYKTVLIFDEIQECSGARASIKAFMIDKRYDIIATGSLLGILGYNRNNDKGIPTGFETILYMKPMDFSEFLLAIGLNKELFSILENAFINKTKLNDGLLTQMRKYFLWYTIVGGMPEVVDIFIKTKDLNRVYQKQHNILEEYKDDFGKHLDKNDNELTDIKLHNKILEIFNNIPNQLAKENKKFQYSLINDKARASTYGDALNWLKEAGIIVICNNLNTIELPLEGNKIENIFKVYFFDIGLLVSMYEKGTSQSILNGDLGIYKGAIYENIIADAFTKNNRNIYYYKRDSGLEIDFVIRYNNKPTIIEVKATNNMAKAAKQVLSDKIHYNVEQCFKFANTNIGEQNNIITAPHYLAYFLKEKENDDAYIFDLPIDNI